MLRYKNVNTLHWTIVNFTLCHLFYVYILSIVTFLSVNSLNTVFTYMYADVSADMIKKIYLYLIGAFSYGFLTCLFH